ncbi:MAG: hypothetical protein HQM16_13740 [Deltaproteobacteria bacterium]|nr:hypothetical protein [Deltaproteobacteria bacterium]
MADPLPTDVQKSSQCSIEYPGATPISEKNLGACPVAEPAVFDAFTLDKYGNDPLIAAQRAWSEGRLIHHAMSLEGRPHGRTALNAAATTAVAALESRFKKYFKDTTERIDLKSDFIINKIGFYCFAPDWERAGHDVKTFLSGCTDQELTLLYSAVVLIDFLRIEKQDAAFSVETNKVRDFFDADNMGKDRYWNCVSISLIGLHLLKTVGVDGFMAGTLNMVLDAEEGHVGLVLPLDNGLSVYLNNGEEFLPPRHWGFLKGAEVSTKARPETVLQPWGAVAWVHDALAIDYGVAGNFKKAEDEFKQALAINPDSAITRLNLAAALASQDKLTEAVPHLIQAVEINPDLSVARRFLDDITTELKNRAAAVEP